MKDIVDELKGQTLLRGLEADDIGKLAAQVETRTIPKDEHVFWEGSPSEGIYLIREGKIEISKATADGWSQPLVHLTKGQFLGEIALLDKSNHATDARAVETTQLFFLSSEVFQQLEQDEPAIMLKIIKNIAIIGGLNVRRMNQKFLKVLINY